MLYGICGWQSSGKTATALAIIRQLLTKGYKTNEIIGNCLFRKWSDANSVNNEGLRLIVKAMVTEHIKHKILLIDEADRVFPSRFWHDKAQTEALIGLWQDEKLFNQVIYTQHMGRSVDAILKRATQIEIIPKYNKYADAIRLTIINHVDGQTMFNTKTNEVISRPRITRDILNNVSVNCFPYYDRWETID